MKKLSRAVKFPWMSSVLSAVIVGALCFSVGEGLRLTPFPVSTSTQTDDAHFSRTNAASLSQYGPLNVPTQTQKRSKRQIPDLGGPATAGTRAIAPELSLVSGCVSTGVVSVAAVARPAGRAPPFLF